MNGVQQKVVKETPKTPGGISKSLLTPCRRVGLSRKWRKSGSAPFISPLNTQNSTPETKSDKVEKKRKRCDDNEHIEVNNETTKELGMAQDDVCSPMSNNNQNKNNDITSTPVRSSQVQRKKTKVLTLSNSQETDKEEPNGQRQIQTEKLFGADESNINIAETLDTKPNKEINDTQLLEVESKAKSKDENVSKLTRTESKSKKLSLKKSLSKSDFKSSSNEGKERPKHKVIMETAKPKEKSPNNLTKECIVVIQNKILKTIPPTTSEAEKALPESDSELDLPLSTLKQNNTEGVTLNILDDNDFISKPVQKKVRNLSMNKKHKTISPIESNNTSQSSLEDTDRRTILVKKTYDKVTKPQKAKSTGSITQKDIEELKARIEMKKKLLLAKSMEETGELRDLIKKWQKGCQDALMELLDLMKKKLPDRQNMDYAEILATLKIPAQLVGYDSENDCFITPDDTNVLSSTFKF